MKRFRQGMWVIVGVVVALGLSVVPSHAAVNLLSNGSFESGLTGWTADNGGGTYPVSTIVTDGVNTAGAFGEPVPADTIVGGSPDPAGTYAAYFVDDIVPQSLTQSIFLPIGTYTIGFDTYYPLNGYRNNFNASFDGTIVDVLLVDTTVKDGTAQVWNHYEGSANVIAPGIYDVAFNFTPGGVPAADVVVDRVYVTVPEPGTLILLGSGLLGLAITGARKKFRK